MIEVELFFMSTASYSHHIPEEIIYDMPQISKTREFMKKKSEETGKLMVQDFKTGCWSINQKEK